MKDGHGGVVHRQRDRRRLPQRLRRGLHDGQPRPRPRPPLQEQRRRAAASMENVFMRNVKIGQVAEAVLTIDLLYEEGAKGALHARRAQRAPWRTSPAPPVRACSSSVGFPGAVIDNIRISQLHLRRRHRYRHYTPRRPHHVRKRHRRAGQEGPQPQLAHRHGPRSGGCARALSPGSVQGFRSGLRAEPAFLLCAVASLRERLAHAWISNSTPPPAPPASRRSTSARP